jgi:DNA repair exonuclease SbcCD ATPase subunit
MKLTLVNFLCYENKTFIINENELTLIEGPSGKGKSTIMKGILFALFGTGTKLQTYGKTSCKVCLEFNDLKIERSKRPNTLKVNDNFEDSAGQELINRKFGEFFTTTSYIQQNAVSSFVLLSPADKMNFLETFAFKNDNIDELKQRNNKLIKKYNEDVIRCESKINTLNEQLKDKILPEKVRFPIKCKRSDVDKITAKNKQQVSNLNNIIDENTNSVNNIKENITDAKLLHNNLVNCDTNIKNYNTKVESLKKQLSSIFYKGDDHLEEITKIYDGIIKNEKRIKLEQSYDEKRENLTKIKKEETDKNNKKIEEINSELWRDYNKAEIDDIISEYEILLKDRQKLDSLFERQSNYTHDNIETLEEDKIVLEKQLDEYNKVNEEYDRCKNILECPNCKNNLKLIKNKLVSVSEQIRVTCIDIEVINNTKSNLNSVVDDLAIQKNNALEFQKIYEKINKINNKYDEIPEFKSIQDDILYLKSYKNKQFLLEKELENIKESSIVKNLEEELEKLKIEIDKFPKSNLSSYDKNEILTEIYAEKKYKDKCDFLKKEIDECNILIENIENDKQHKIDKYTNTYSIRCLDILNSNLVDSSKLLESNKLELAELIKINKIIDDWHNYQCKKEEYDKLNDSLKMIKSEKNEFENRYTASLKFKNLILSCEAAIMSDIINNINLSAKTYLDIIFPEDPINVSLTSFKENKKGVITPSINIEIEYKGMECELNMLSGGELSRIILAYTLALTELFNSPLILLDESTASLDQESTNIVFDAIKEHCNTKTVIIIAHQVIQGGFENVISLN